jgi:minor extracellular serine protease Vpr
VIAGGDFVGDAYNGVEDAPAPDPNPLDCATGNAGGHGTHVAGTVGGYGVLEDGTTFTGPYNATTFTDNDFLVGPGVAPDVKLVGLRVFGCSGSSAVVHEAIDWVVEYNVLNPDSTPIDVINMSLGSSFGETTDPSAIAAQNAAETGIIVVAASGNAGNIPYITGSPAVSPAVISVAGSIAGGTIDVLAFEVLTGAAAGTYPMEPASFGHRSRTGTSRGPRCGCFLHRSSG